jgi:hypothetical protein
MALAHPTALQLSMIYRYVVAHSDAALPATELVLHGLTADEVEWEYENVQMPFRMFFECKANVAAARIQRTVDGEGLEILVDVDGDQDAVDGLVRDFLIWWNGMKRGLAVVLRRRLTP